ncbi:LicD family-domain-containing protein [Hypoxylon sp. NC0597]|nr:LicD family-domain-containing protein [Hypoxylon sp. NC0597]
MHTLLPFLVLSLLITASAASPITSHRKSSPKSKAHEGQQPPKYFHEAGGSLELGHYDARYFKGEVPYEAHGPALRHLIRSWLATARGLGVETETWLAHGTLLGWWWSGRVMPWDYDLDVQMPTATLAYLGRHFNRTLHDYRFPVGDDGDGAGLGEGGRRSLVAGDGEDGGCGDRNNTGETYDGYVNKTYLLDVNPHHTDVGRGNGHNIIDARWIDVSNGLFIDITGLAERDPAGSPGVWSCKNAHKYRTAELYPVRHTEFEGVPASVPYAFDKILTDEYGSKSLVNTEWAGHHWAPELKEWVKDPDLPPEDEETKLNKQQQGSEAVVVVVEKTVMKGASKRDP